MRNRTLGILGGVLLVGGVVLGIASGIASNRLAQENVAEGPAIHRPDDGALPRHRGPGAPGPLGGNPGRRNFPGQGRPLPSTTSPTTR